jgi:glycosyltransferase involved in cell wall biosynthesis
VIALVGRIARWKGQDRFIRVAADVLRTVDAHFVIVGSPIFGCDPEYVPELMAAVTAANGQERIHFVPWQDDMRNVYAAVDLAANCSTREPFARTMLEALASGIPIVCFDDAGSCEILAQHPCGTAVPAGDEAAFAAAVRMYLTDSNLLAGAQASARVAVRSFDIDVAWQAFAEVILRVGRRRSRTALRPAIRASVAEPSAPR